MTDSQKGAALELLKKMVGMVEVLSGLAEPTQESSSEVAKREDAPLPISKKRHYATRRYVRVRCGRCRRLISSCGFAQVSHERWHKNQEKKSVKKVKAAILVPGDQLRAANSQRSISA